MQRCTVEAGTIHSWGRTPCQAPTSTLCAVLCHDPDGGGGVTEAENRVITASGVRRLERKPLASPLTYSETLGKSLDLSVPQQPRPL